MTEENNNVYKGDIAWIADADIAAPLNNADHPSCSYYQSAYSRAVESEKDAGNTELSAVYQFIARLCSFMPRYGNREQLYEPYFIMDGKRSFLPEDLTDHDLDAVAALLKRSSDSTLKARFGDILWIRQKDHKAATEAAKAFLESGTRLFAGELWTDSMNEFTRALQLAFMLGQDKPLWKEIIASVEKLALAVSVDDTSFKAAQIMDVLLNAGNGNNPSQFVGRAEQTAKVATEALDYYRAEEYWKVEARWRQAAGDEDGSKEALINAAEAKIQYGEALVLKPESGHLAAATHLAQAVESLRQASAPPERVAEMKRKLLDYQKKAMGEMKVVKHEIDIGDAVNSALSHVESDDFQEAIRRYSLGHPLIDPEALKERTLDIIKKYPISNIFGAIYVEQDGRTKARLCERRGRHFQLLSRLHCQALR